MTTEYLSLTEIAAIFGATSHQVGRWLKQVGLRTESGSPSRAAFDGDFVSRRESTNPGTYFYTWHSERTMGVLDALECPRAKAPGKGAEEEESKEGSK